MKLWLEKNDIEIYSVDTEGISVIAQRFIRTLKNRIYKYMTSISKNEYTDKLDDIVHKCNNTYKTIKGKPADIKPSTYIDSSKEINDKDSKFKIGDIFRISKYKNCLDKNYNIFQTTRFNHAMIFFKLIDKYKLSDIYISHNNCLGHMLIA